MPSVLNQARGLLETIGKIATVDAVMAAQDPKALEKAESDLWAWYLEWSQIARIARPPTAGGRTWSASPKSIWRPRAPCARARRQRVHRTERSTSKASNGSTRTFAASDQVPKRTQRPRSSRYASSVNASGSTSHA